jgi:hypothetical protein
MNQIDSQQTYAMKADNSQRKVRRCSVFEALFCFGPLLLIGGKEAQTDQNRRNHNLFI